MATKTAAQEEFDSILSKSARGDKPSAHPADQDDYAHDRDNGELDEDEAYTQQRIDSTMRTSASTDGGSTLLQLPPREFDMGRTTGVKGVIADARSFEEARRVGRSSSVRTSKPTKATVEEETKSDASMSDDEAFLDRWRQQRRLELQVGSDIRTRRTSPSVRRYGRFDEVDALGYLDAIEKVARDTVVVVFVYDAQVCLCPPLPCCGEIT
jgi:hypothetical protein